jgi:hypothetical protein
MQIEYINHPLRAYQQLCGLIVKTAGISKYIDGNSYLFKNTTIAYVHEHNQETLSSLLDLRLIIMMMMMMMMTMMIKEQ